MTRLLVIACSQRKNPAKGLLPAIARYDGPAFRVLRKYLREEPRETPCILILSAKYGLIAADRQIPDYDCRLSTGSATELRPQILETVRHAVQTQRPLAIGICAGKDYRMALAGFADVVPQGIGVEFIEGGQGPRLTALRRWLRRED
jgi:hypothetical protein